MDTESHQVTVTGLRRRIVRVLAPRDEADGILEDLGEEAAQVAAKHGAGAARRWLRWQVAHSAGPWVARRARESSLRLRRSTAMMHRGVWSDVRIAARRLGQSRGFSALAVLTLAVGIGAVSTVFSLAHALWLKPLPYLDPDGLVWIHARHEASGASSSLTPVELAEHRREKQALSAVAGFMYGAHIAHVNGEPVRVVSHYVTPDLFRVLGVRPALGRDFTDSDATPGSRVVMLSEATWTRRFGRDPAVAGKTMTMDGASYEIAGVMPRGFTFPRGFEAEVWVSAGLTSLANPPGRHIQVIARLAPGRTIADASAEADVRARHLSAAFPDTNKGWGALVSSAGATTSRTNRLAFQALLGIVGLFLLMACANLAGLLLARNATRRTELAVRLSIGASAWRLARMLLVESTLLAGAGCAAGLLLASYASRALAAFMPPRTPDLELVSVNLPVVLVAMAVSLLSAVLIALLPALGLRSMRPSEALAASRTAARGVTRPQRMLAVVEIALAVVLMVGASVMLRAFVGLLDRDRGFDADGLVALNVSLPFSDDSYLATATRARVFSDMLERVAAVPGVRRVGATTGFPGSPLGVLGGATVTPPGGGTPVMAAIHASTPGYFETMGIPIKAGRPFSPTDAANTRGVAIVNEVLAREFPGGSPLGHAISLSIQGSPPAPFEIVGVAGNISLSGRAGHRIFVPLAQASPYWIDLVIRPDGRTVVMPGIRQALRSINPNLLLENESSFQTIISNSLGLERAQSAFAILVGALSAIVAGVGLCALMTFTVAQRRREFGIRLALGSGPRQLFRDAMSSALRLVGAGLLLGVAAAAVLVQALKAQVFGLGSADALAYASAVALVLVIAIAAVWVPARRVMRTDPLIAMRVD